MDYKELRVWQEARILVRDVYLLTRALPKEEVFGLASQTRRSAVSVPSNIAEGKGRNSQRELVQFLYRARGSLLELETQVLLASDLGYVEEVTSAAITEKIKTVACTLNGLIRRVQEGIKVGGEQ